LLSAFAWFFLSLHRPSPSFDPVGFPLKSANTIFHGSAFEAELFHYVQASKFARLPDRSYRCDLSSRGSRDSTGLFASRLSAIGILSVLDSMTMSAPTPG
jgi:hypothetical protein